MNCRWPRGPQLNLLQTRFVEGRWHQLHTRHLEHDRFLNLLPEGSPVLHVPNYNLCPLCTFQQSQSSLFHCGDNLYLYWDFHNWTLSSKSEFGSQFFDAKLLQVLNPLVPLLFCSIATNILSKESRIAAEERWHWKSRTRAGVLSPPCAV